MNDVSAMVRVLRVALVLAFVFALGGAFVPGRLGTASSVACLTVLIGVPVVRVGWLTAVWVRMGDRRSATLGAVLLGVLLVGGVVALL
ncbi:MAG: hypothetical protein MUE36_12750 [Acidimicrobiales bacterium]|nr:hypothetical protein [Acidimicrobiales bacterium]